MDSKKILSLHTLGIAVILISILSACDGDEPAVPGAEFIILNNVNDRANISVYDYRTMTLTESIYTVESLHDSPLSNAAKKDNHVVIATGVVRPKLIKVDINTGKEEHAVDAWNYFRPFVGIHNNHVIVCEAQPIDDRFLFLTKIYDEDLILLDSISETGVLNFDAATIIGDELFYAVVIVDVGVFIKAKNLNTKQTRSVEITHRCEQLTSLGTNRLLAVAGERYFIIDTGSMSVAETATPSVTSATFNAEENTLYYLSPVAQPSMYLYSLAKLDLSTGERTVLSTSPSIVPPLFYDAENELILSGGLKVFSKTGEVLQTSDVPGTTLHIFKK